MSKCAVPQNGQSCCVIVLFFFVASSADRRLKTKRPQFRFDTDSRVSLGPLCWQFGEVSKLTARVFGAPLDSGILPNRPGRAGAGKVIIQDVRIRQIAISALDSVDYKRRVSALLRGRAEWASWNVREWQIALCRACTPRLVRRFCRAIASPDLPHLWLGCRNLRWPGNDQPCVTMCLTPNDVLRLRRRGLLERLPRQASRRAAGNHSAARQSPQILRRYASLR